MYKQDVGTEVAEALLDVGASLPLKTLRIPFSKKIVKLKLVMKRPMLGTQIRIARIYLTLGVTFSEMKQFTKEQEMGFLARHGKKVSKMVALTICRGGISGFLFSGIMAWILRWFVEDIYLQAAYTRFVALLGTKSFENIIRSAQMTNPLSPLLSQSGKRS